MTTEKNYHRYLRHFEDVQDFFTFQPKWPPIIVELSEEQQNIQRCFENDIIRARIFDNALENNPLTNRGAWEILDLRRVNKSWNVSMLAEFRRRTRTNKLLFHGSYSNPYIRNFKSLPENIQLRHHDISINFYRVKLSELSNCFEFFNKYGIHPINTGAEIQVSNIWSEHTHLKLFIHNQIIETLYATKKSYLSKIFGMKLFCEGCETCLEFADECDEHDFVTMKKLERGFPDGRVFKNIEVGVEVQNELVQKFIDPTEDKDSGLKMMVEFIKNNFMAKNVTFEQDEVFERILPVEVFTVFIHQWKATSTAIYSYWNSQIRTEGMLIGRFSDFVLMPHCPETAMRWSGVSIELPAVRDGFYNMIAIFRQILPSKKLFLNDSWITTNLPTVLDYPRMGPAQRFVMQRIADYATDENFSNFALEIAVPDDATFDVANLCGMLRQLGRSWEVHEPIYGTKILCRCGRRLTTYRMANNRIQGRLNISMTEYIPNSRFRCHSGYPYSSPPGWFDDEDN
ncbi:unnamed protein product [Caenorhabditis nigoni]